MSILLVRFDQYITCLLYTSGSNDPKLYTESELNDLVRNLDFSKDLAEVLCSRLKEKSLLATDTSFYWFQSREKERFVPFFSQEGELVFFKHVPGLTTSFNIEYKANDWRLLIDSSKRNLQEVL